MNDAMNPNFDPILDRQLGNITFLGGTADLQEAAIAPLPTAASSSTPSGGQLPLSMMSVGDRIWVVQIKGGHRMARRLMDVGIVQGCEITVVSRTESGSVIVALQGCRIGLGAGMAHRVTVTTNQPDVTTPTPQLESTAAPVGESTVTREDAMTVNTLTLGSLAVGQSGQIVGYEPGGHAYRSKLLSMGLTPGTHFTVKRQAPMGDPVDIEVRGYHLSLRKGEAAALQVERLSPEEVTHES
ncbi:MAG: ferrous iron transport protein A [Leptolyngbya sp. SIOISBB]|nr:ferrous iron transport protein A [Leptolyngbya sp. SIOISBB]